MERTHIKLHVDGKTFLFPIATSSFDLSRKKVWVHPQGWEVDETPFQVCALLGCPMPDFDEDPEPSLGIASFGDKP